MISVPRPSRTGTQRVDGVFSTDDHQRAFVSGKIQDDSVTPGFDSSDAVPARTIPAGDGVDAGVPRAVEMPSNIEIAVVDMERFDAVTCSVRIRKPITITMRPRMGRRTRRRAIGIAMKVATMTRRPTRIRMLERDIGRF